MTLDAGLDKAFAMLLEGVWYTVLVTVLSYVLAVVLGLVVALARVSRNRVLRTAGATYVEIFRGIPSLVLVLLIYFGLSAVLALSPVPAAVAGLSLVNAAYLAEYFRSGIESVPMGQWDAAQAVGMTQRQVFWRVVAPQGVGVALPPATSQAIGLLKESAVVSAIGVSDITFQALSAAHRGSPPIQLFLLAGALYLALSLPIAGVSRRVEKVVRGRTAS